MSGLFPAGCGTTIITGRCGQVWARAGSAMERAAPASNMRRDIVVMVILPGIFGGGPLFSRAHAV
jgi:hypothetical protein